jgi:hypothetical protein
VDILIVILVLALLAVVILVVSAPLRAARRPPGIEPARDRAAQAGGQTESAEDRADLEAAREAKYREIRDAELDYRTGKLSQKDYAAVDGTLRAEAVEILNRLQVLERES